MAVKYFPALPTGIDLATVSGVTGASAVTDTSSRAGKTIYKWTTASNYITPTGTITLATAGYVEILVVGGAGAGGCGSNGQAGGGGGAGGYIYETSAYLPAGVHKIAVGAGGVMSGPGSIYPISGAGSNVGPYYSAGGGAGAGLISNNGTIRAMHGGSGGGVGGSGQPGEGILGQGYRGSGGNIGTGGGGGGANGAGINNVATAGPGLANSITGTSVTYSTGGAGGASSGTTAGTAGTANTGIGGGGGQAGSNATYILGAAGGSGFVVVVVG
jgi:hypothetical protein